MPFVVQRVLAAAIYHASIGGEVDAQREADVSALAGKLEHVKKMAAQERAGLQQNEAVRVRSIEALKREVNRLRGEREQLEDGKQRERLASERWRVYRRALARAGGLARAPAEVCSRTRVPLSDA